MIELRIVVASTRPGRFGPVVADWVRNQVPPEVFAVELVDLAEVALPLLDEPEIAATGIYAHDHTRRWQAIVEGAEAIVVVTPEYNDGYPASLKNAIDYLYAEWAGKPIGVVGYGHRAAASCRAQLSTVLRRVKAHEVPGVGLRYADHVADGQVTPDAALERETRQLFAALATVCRPDQPAPFARDEPG